MQNFNFSSITGNRIEFLSIHQLTHLKVCISHVLSQQNLKNDYELLLVIGLEYQIVQ